MSTTLQDFRPEALIEAIEANFFAYWASLGRVPGVELQDDARTLRFTSGIPHPIMNGVCRARLTSENADAAIADTVAHFRSRRLPFFWWMGPSTRPADLGRYLEARGFTPAGGPVGMALDLHRMNDDLAAPADLAVEQVTDRETLAQWARATMSGFEEPESLAEPWADLAAGMGLAPDLPLRSYLARLRGEPVATSQLFMAEGVAGIYTVATIPSARRQGIGAAVTLTALRAAREEGYRIGILHASTMGESVYRRIGFQEYCRLQLYMWAEPGADS